MQPIENPISASGDPDAASPIGSGRMSARRDLILRVFRALDEAGIDYCMPHGHEELPGPDGSDVDIIIDPAIPSAELSRFFVDRRALLGVEILESRGYLQVLATSDAAASVAFDFAPDVTLGPMHVLSGREVLANRIRRDDVWIPQPDVEFICLLLRSLYKGSMKAQRRRRLSALYEQDGAGCDRRINGFFAGPDADRIVAAARRAQWDELDPQTRRLSRAMSRRAFLRHPLRTVRLGCDALARRFDRILRPSGMRVVLLGPDGAGKSTLSEALEVPPLAVFDRTDCRGFAPKMFRRLLRRRQGPTDQPHALPPRSAAVSIIRAGYWLAHQTAEHAASRIDLARATLIIYDRHFVDILVDHKRYRYGGPLWLLSMIWSILPKPDLVLLLDAPAEVLFQRKQELSLDETDRQRRRYLALVTSLENGHVLDAAQPFESVFDQVSRILVAHLARREAERRNFPASVVEP
ncbi:MAG: hypothetical protein EA385_01545 [Salinarimonadaceae bacterium]|nr:MAG: hypothetical protein EA385_01545 [Salinarimonadaceae bacterium]